MEKGRLAKIGKGLIVLIGLGILIGIIRSRMMPSSSSIGIIGGADGPTAVFVTGNFSLIKMLSIIGGILFLAGIVIIIMLIIKGKIKK